MQGNSQSTGEIKHEFTKQVDRFSREEKLRANNVYNMFHSYWHAKSGRVAQWTERRSTEPEVPGSTPGMIDRFCHSHCVRREAPTDAPLLAPKPDGVIDTAAAAFSGASVESLTLCASHQASAHAAGLAQALRISELW